MQVIVLFYKQGGGKHTGEKYYYVKDHLGSIRVTMNSGNTRVSAQDYFAFGSVIPGRSYSNGDANAKYKFTEKERDSETNYDYFACPP